MSDLYDDVKGWAKRNPTIAGAVAGFGAGTVVPGLGNIVGAIGGGILGHYAGKDVREREAQEMKAEEKAGLGRKLSGE